MRLFLAPRSNETSQENFLATLESGYPLSEVRQFLSDEEMQVLGNREKLYIWGNQKGKGPSWKKMQLGDYVAFYARGYLVYAGRCILKKHSPELARQLWGNAPKKEETWEYTFFLDNIRPISIPIEEIKKLGSYKFIDNMIVQGFMPLNERGMNNVTKIFGSVEAFLGAFSSGLRPIDILKFHELTDDQDSIPQEELAEIDAIVREKDAEVLLRDYEQQLQEEIPTEVERRVKIIRRNIAIVRQMKDRFGNKCQICGFTFKQKNGSFYSEVAHIEPISSKKAGVDRPSNLVVLCPNHHKMLDMGHLQIVSETEYSVDGKTLPFLAPLLTLKV